jgi:hypothetical protein
MWVEPASTRGVGTLAAWEEVQRTAFFVRQRHRLSEAALGTGGAVFASVRRFASSVRNKQPASHRCVACVRVMGRCAWGDARGVRRPTMHSALDLTVERALCIPSILLADYACTVVAMDEEEEPTRREWQVLLEPPLGLGV